MYVKVYKPNCSRRSPTLFHFTIYMVIHRFSRFVLHKSRADTLGLQLKLIEIIYVQVRVVFNFFIWVMIVICGKKTFIIEDGLKNKGIPTDCLGSYQ